MSITLNKKRFNLLNMNTNERIRKRMESIGMRQKDLVAKTGASRGTVSLWINGPSEPQGENLLKLARVLSCSPEWILNGIGSPDEIHSNVEAAPRLKGLVPLINEVQAGAWTEIKTGFDDSEISEWIPTAKANSRYSFALRVVGDSMFDPYEKRSLNEGMIVIVDPEKPALHRSMVVARLANSDKATVKELVIDGDSQFLRPFNRQYGIINVTEGVVIIGVVVGAFSSFI